MPQKLIYTSAAAPNSKSADSAYYAQRAAMEREHAITAANEVVAAVHEGLAYRYAALAAERSRNK